MPGKIFVNYRRDDDPGFTQALYMRLEAEFSTGDLFMDVEGHIRPGDDFIDVLADQISQCDIFLAVLGPRWMELLAARRNDPDDFVAIEIKAALDQGKRVIPVLVGGATMPRADILPEAIRSLARRNAVGLRPERFRADCQGLVSTLKDLLAAIAQERTALTDPERRSAEAARLRGEKNAEERAKALEKQIEEQAAAGLSSQEARRAAELVSWELVKNSSDPQELRDHLARFAGGSTERQAHSLLEQLAWSGLSKFPTVEALRDFIDEFPGGAHSALARRQLAELDKKLLQEEQAREQRVADTQSWAGASAGSRDSVERYLRQFPDGEFVAAARERLRQLDIIERAPLSKRSQLWRGVLATVLSLLWMGIAVTLMVLFFSFNVAWFNKLDAFVRLAIITLPIGLMIYGLIPIWDWVYKDRLD